MKKNIFSFEEFSIYDGPGIRTTVFIKGCPLKCSWCHNPEGQSFESEIIKSPNGCIGCGMCIKYAKKNNGKIIYTKESMENCPKNLLRVCGCEYSPNEVYDKVMKNKELLSGGVTFSGGEPLSAGNFLTECLALFKGRLHTAVQTCGYADSAFFTEVCGLCDYFLYDIKLADDREHIKYTGVSNRQILENLKILKRYGKDFVIRIPLIPKVTDTEKNINNICRILKDNDISYAELMPYNKMAGGKYKLLGRKYCPAFDETVEVNIREDIWKQNSIKIKIL